jgi:exodeoxyribonuclease VII large subunit
MVDRAFRAATGRVAAERGRLERVAASLRAVGPAATLARGYSIARREDGSVVRDPHQVAAGDQLEVVVHEGTIATRVGSTRRASPEELIG